MSVVSYSELVHLKSGCTPFGEPFQPSPVIDAPLLHVSSSSVDVTLGPSIMREGRAERGNHLCSINGKLPAKMVRMNIPEAGLVIKPGEFILAATTETFNMPAWLSGQYIMKSSVSRVGLEQLNACWIQPGFRGVLVLELKNMTQRHNILIKAGDRIGQVIFHRHEPVPDGKLRGRYTNQQGATPALPEFTAPETEGGR